MFLRSFRQVLDPTSHVNKVLVATRRRCGRAVDGDEVVVEILSHEKRPTDSGGEYAPQAQVCGVLKDNSQFAQSFVVCTADRRHTGAQTRTCICSTCVLVSK